MKKDWLCYSACIPLPHIMLVVGLILLSKRDPAKKSLGKKLCLISTGVLILGTFIYYIMFTPLFGLD